MKELTKMIKASDNWCPCYANNTVEVKLRELPSAYPKSPRIIRLSIWGADDLGYDIDFYENEFVSAERYYDFAKYIYDNLPNIINMDFVEKIGMKRF